MNIHVPQAFAGPTAFGNFCNSWAGAPQITVTLTIAYASINVSGWSHPGHNPSFIRMIGGSFTVPPGGLITPTQNGAGADWWQPTVTRFATMTGAWGVDIPDKQCFCAEPDPEEPSRSQSVQRPATIHWVYDVD